MRRLIESIDSISKAAKKPTGPKFPGYWKGEEPASKARSRMVGEESVIKELHNTTTSAEYKLQEALNNFKQQYGQLDPSVANMPKTAVDKQISSMALDPSVANMPKTAVDKQISSMAQNAATTSGVAAPVAKPPAYTGIDPNVRQRMGMQPATQGEIQSYLDKNPPGVTTSTGQRVTSGSEAPVVSGGLTSVAKAADAASPDRAQSVARTPAAPVATKPVQPAVTPAPAATPEPIKAVVGAPATPAKPQAVKPAPVMPQKAAAGSWQDIWKNNPNIKNPNLIYTGQEIKLPNGTSTIVDKGDTLSSIARRYRQGGYNVGTEVEPTPAATKTSAVAPSSTAASAVAKPQTQPQQNQTATPVKAPSTPTVKLGLGDPGYFPLITNKVEKRSDGKWYFPGSNKPVKSDVAKYAETQLARQASTAGTATKPSASTASTNRTAPVTGNSSFADLVGNAETGNKNIPNQTGSSAAGIYGFMPDGFKGFVNAAKPGEPLYGKTWNDYLTDVNVQKAAMAAQEKDINNRLAKNNIEPNVGNKYLMHFLGAPTAIPVMKALEKDPKTPLSTWFGRDPYPDVAIADTPAAFNKFKQSNPGHPSSRLDYNQYRSSRPAIYRQNPQLSRENLRTVSDISNWSNRKMAAAGSQKNEAVDKLAEQFAAFMEAQDPYGPEYQAMVQRVGQRAKQGPLKTVWDPVKRVYKNVPVKQEKQVKEYENAQDQDSQVTSPPSPDATASSKQFVTDKELQNMNAQKTLEADAGAQDPNKQTTSPPSPAAVAKAATTPAAPDVSVATAKTTMAGLKPALGPGVDTNAAATGVTKANLGQQLNPAEQEAVSALTPLVMKAATIPSAAPQLRSALTNAGTMAKAAAAKQGKM